MTELLSVLTRQRNCAPQVEGAARSRSGRGVVELPGALCAGASSEAGMGQSEVSR